MVRGLCLLLHVRVIVAVAVAVAVAVVVAVVVAVAVVGCRYHATLRYDMQMLDELPMVYNMCIWLYIWFENPHVQVHHTTCSSTSSAPCCFGDCLPHRCVCVPACVSGSVVINLSLLRPSAARV